jgi:hypothetical protein
MIWKIELRLLVRLRREVFVEFLLATIYSVEEGLIARDTTSKNKMAAESTQIQEKKCLIFASGISLLLFFMPLHCSVLAH